MEIGTTTITVSKYNEIDLIHENLLKNNGWEIALNDFGTKVATSPEGTEYDLCLFVEGSITKEMVDSWGCTEDILRDVPDSEFAWNLSEMLNNDDKSAVYRALNIKE